MSFNLRRWKEHLPHIYVLLNEVQIDLEKVSNLEDMVHAHISDEFEIFT